jgi:hypothetical protein
VGGVGLPGEVSSQVAELEVIEHDPGIRTGNIEAGGVLITRDQVHQAHVVDEGK